MGVGVGFSSVPETHSETVPLAVTQVSSEADLQAALVAHASEIEITTSFPITSPNTIQANYEVAISSADPASPVTLSRGAGYLNAFFVTTGGGKLTLQDIVLDGGGEAATGVIGSLVEASDRGTITLNDGAVLCNNVKTVGNGGAISAVADSSVYINGGALIENNKLTGTASGGIGGGVYVGRSYPQGDSSQLFMDGGTIRGNESSGDGGGLALNSATSVAYMSGGEIVGNTAASYSLGGGVATAGIFYLSGGSISDNTATIAAGGVSMTSGMFHMNGGEISNNEALSGNGLGGGIYQGSAGYVEITGGKIAGNKAIHGGAVFRQSTSVDDPDTGLVISGDAVIDGNSATGIGGGVVLSIDEDNTVRERVFEVSGNAKITNNVAEDVGGIYVEASKSSNHTTISLGGNAEVSGNRATGEAGGMYLAGIEVEITDSFAVTGNTAQYGGGIRLMSGDLAPTALTLRNNVTVSGNTAELGGGVCLAGDATLTTAGDVSIDGNTADLGAGLFLLGSEATVGGFSTVDGNSASFVGASPANNAAGGIYLVQDEDTTGSLPVYTPASVSLEDSASVSNNTATTETGGIIVDEGATLNVSGSVSVAGNQMVGGSSGISVYPDGEFNVWGTPQVGVSGTDNGIRLATGTHANIPAGENLLSGSWLNFDGVDPEADGTLVVKRAGGSTASVDESIYMNYMSSGFIVAKSAADGSEYVLAPAPDPTPATKTLSIARLYGADRFETSAQVSTYARDIAAAQTLIVASGDDRNFPDALAASSLSGANGNAPIVLTDPASLPASTRAALGKAASAAKVYIIGDRLAVSEKVESQIASILPNAQIERLGGVGRQETAERVFRELGSSASKTAILARSMNFPDSLSASPWAAATVSPIFLTGFDERSITQGTLDALAAGNFDRLIVLGDRYSIPDSVAAQARDAAGLADSDVVRLGGNDRVDTSLLFAEWATDAARGSEALSWDNMAVSRADRHPDALSGGALQGMHGSVVVLTWPGEVHPGIVSAVTAASGSINEIRFLGNEYSVSEDLIRAYTAPVPRGAVEWKPDASVAIDLG